MFFGVGLDGGVGKIDNEKFYKTLHVEKTADAQQIKKAYRKLAIKHHPDKGGDPEQFKEITRAYEVLSDEEKRKKYDRYGEEGLDDDGFRPGDATDIFEMVFGQGKAAPEKKKRGKDVNQTLQISLPQIYNGHTKKLAINRTVVDSDKGIQDCQQCNGKGTVRKVVRMGNMIQQTQEKCEKCGGQGQTWTTRKEKELLEVMIEKGAPDGHRVTFYNKADEQPGFEAGDVHFIINEKPHPDFERVRADLFITREITLLEALTGVEVDITHLDGRKVLLKTKPGAVINPVNHVPVEWVQFDEVDIEGSNVATAKCQAHEIDKLKEICKNKGFSGFVVDLNAGEAHFRAPPEGTAHRGAGFSRHEYMRKAMSIQADKRLHKKGFKTFIVPEPHLEKAIRTRMCVKGEGMPVFKNPMLKGNMFVDFVLKFPTSISDEQARALRMCLPGPKTRLSEEETVDMERQYMVPGDPLESEKQYAQYYEENEAERQRNKENGFFQNV